MEETSEAAGDGERQGQRVIRDLNDRVMFRPSDVGVVCDGVEDDCDDDNSSGEEQKEKKRSAASSALKDKSLPGLAVA